MSEICFFFKLNFFSTTSMKNWPNPIFTLHELDFTFCREEFGYRHYFITGFGYNTRIDKYALYLNY